MLRTEPFTFKEFAELAQAHRERWHTARYEAYQADPEGVYPMHQFTHASDMFPGILTIPLHYHYNN